MALITRVSRLFRADLHAVLDRIEEPESLLKQAVREMEQDLADDERRIRGLHDDQRQVKARQADLDQSFNEIEAELDICFGSGKDDLARTLIKRKLEAQQFQKVLSRRLTSIEATLVQLNTRVAHNRARLEGVRQKVELLVENETLGDPECWGTPDVTVRGEDVEIAFLREKKNRGRS